MSYFLSPLLSRKASWLGSRPRKFFNMSEASWKKKKKQTKKEWHDIKKESTRSSSNKWTKSLFQDCLHHVAKLLYDCFKGKVSRNLTGSARVSKIKILLFSSYQCYRFKPPLRCSPVITCHSWSWQNDGWPKFSDFSRLTDAVDGWIQFWTISILRLMILRIFACKIR